MKKRICLIILCFVAVFACAFGLSACGNPSGNNGDSKDGSPTAITKVEGGTIDGSDIYMFVDAGITSVALLNAITCVPNSTWKLYEDNRGQIEIPTKVAASASGELLKGVNIFYIVVSSLDGVDVNLYTLTIYRSFEISVNYYDGNRLIKTDKAFTGYEYTAYTPYIMGYTFNAWKRGGNVFTSEVLWGNLNLYADKTANTYKVTFITDNKSQAVKTITATYDQEITLPSSSKTGYTFNGWLDGGEISATTFVWKFTEDKEYTAKFTANQYTITYIPNGGTLQSTTQQVTYDSAYSLYDISRLGYTFEGYTHNGKLFTSGTYTIADNITINAEWEIITYTITYYLNDGENDTANPASYNIATSTITLNSATREGYMFLGWYEDEQFEKQITKIALGSYGNKNLYAKWNYGTEGLKFARSGDTYSVTGYTGSNSAVIIPAEYNDKSVISIGSYAFSRCSGLTNIEIPDSVTSIGSGAFYECSKLISIEIPNSVTSIGESAFSACTAEIKWGKNPAIKEIGSHAFSGYMGTSIAIPDSVTSIGWSAFLLCQSLTSIEIPDSVTSIGWSAFQGCQSLTSISIPDSVTSIGSSAFIYCSSLTSLTLPFVGATKDGSSNTYLGYIFGADSYSSNSSYVPSSLKTVIITGGTSIGYGAFYDGSGLTSITIPESVTSIGSSVFYGCSGLTSITIPDSITSIGNSAFDNCSSLQHNEYDNAYYLGNDGNPYVVLVAAKDAFITSCIINSNTKVIYNSAFDNCSKLTRIVIPDGVISIGDFAFCGCSGLTSITIPDSITLIGSQVFTNCSSLQYNEYDNAYYLGNDGNPYVVLVAVKDASITSCIINSNTKVIYYRAFDNCSKLTSIEIPNGVISIGGSAFNNCNGLISVTIPNSVTLIGGYAFYECSKLISIEIPDGVTSIGGYAFYGCRGLTSVTIGDNVTLIGGAAFYGCSGLTSATFKNTKGWYTDSIGFSSEDLSDPTVAATYLTSDYDSYNWYRG